MEETPTEDVGRKSDDDEEKKEEEQTEKKEAELPELAPVKAETPAEEVTPPPSAEEAPPPAPTEEAAPQEEAAPTEEGGGEDEYKMPTLQDVEKTEENLKGSQGTEVSIEKNPKDSLDMGESQKDSPNVDTSSEEESGGEKPAESAEEEERIDLEAHEEDQKLTACPKCEKNYVGPEDFCTNCGAQKLKTRESVQMKEEIPKAEASGKGNVYKAPALEWHEDEPRTFEVACYNCENVFDATVEKVPVIINCPTCQAQLQIEEIPPEEDDEDDEEDLEITPKEPTIKKVKPPKKGCPQCGGRTRFIPRHFKWFCDTCQKWI